MRLYHYRVKNSRTKWAERIIYQIYPRSFKDSNKDGVGDIQGIIQKLDYLQDGTDRSLGVNAIWISPIYPSPMKDFGYDVSDYCNIDSLFGTFEDFDELVNEAHKRKLKIIMDFIPNHTSFQHQWFLESKSSKTNPKRDWYIWKDPKIDGSPPNNWLSVFGGSAWEFDEKTQQYFLHSFLKEQPDLNWRNPEVKQAMFDVLRFWLKRGVDGFRVDMFEYLFKDKRFLDEPKDAGYVEGVTDPYHALDHIYVKKQPELFELLKDFESVFTQYEDTFMITESYVDLPFLVQLYNAGTTQHAPFNFEFILLDWNMEKYKKFIDAFDKAIGKNYIPTYVLGNHDRERVASRLGQKDARVAAMLQLTLRGLPTIYYGEELGMKDGDIPQDKIQDPFEINVPGLGLGRDKERTPMQWNKAKNAGFSEVEPWLPVEKDYRLQNVEVEQNDAKSMLNFYKTLIHYRKKSQTLLLGVYIPLDLKNDHVLAYMREGEKGKNLVVLNFSHLEQNVILPVANVKLVCSTYMDNKQEERKPTSFLLRPHEGLLFEV